MNTPTLFDENQIPTAPTSSPAPISKPDQPDKSKRKSYYVPVSQRVKEADKNAVKIAHERKLAKAEDKAKKKAAKDLANAIKPVARVKPASKSSDKVSDGTDVCSLCGKTLTRGTSISAGMGPDCAAKIKLLPAGKTLEDHYEAITEVEVPAGYIKLRDALKKINDKGISSYRLIQAIGGDRMLRKPLNSHFKVVLVNHVRYINGEALSNWKELEKI